MNNQSIKHLDLLGKPCHECKQGMYQETTIYDNWEGIVHCNNCGHQEIRHKKVQVELTHSLI